VKTVIVSYSLTGNNQDLASSLSAALGAEHVRITERKRRTMGTIVMDVMFHRTPRITMPAASIEDAELVIFVGPVWMGQIASPFRACLKQLGHKIDRYAFVTICGGATGPNPKLAEELEKRLEKKPACLVDLHIADLLPPEPKPTRDDTMAYRITAKDVQALTDTVVANLSTALTG
jgi:hypothetical protein